MPEHHTQTKQRVRQLLRHSGQVATSATLAKRGLLQAAQAMGLPWVELDCRTRVNQSDSMIRLQFIALEEEQLLQKAGDLMHAAAMTEGIAQFPQLIPPGYTWRLIGPKQRRELGAGHWPDAELLSPEINGYGKDVAVEFDAGYPTDKIRAKLSAYARNGYSQIIWMTSIQSRVTSVIQTAEKLDDAGHLPGVEVTTVWSDFWTPHDRYAERPRCRKKNLSRLHY